MLIKILFSIFLVHFHNFDQSRIYRANTNEINFYRYLNSSSEVKFHYRRPSLFAGVTSQDYPANTKTAKNEGPLCGPSNALFMPFFAIKSGKFADNRGKCPRITNFVHNSSAMDSQNRE